MSRRVLRDLVLQRAEILWRISLEAARSGDLEFSTTASRNMLRMFRAFALKMPPEIKRSLCKGCSAPLVPGVTASYRLRGRGKRTSRVARCLLCGEVHRIEILKNWPPRHPEGQ